MGAQHAEKRGRCQRPAEQITTIPSILLSRRGQVAIISSIARSIYCTGGIFITRTVYLYIFDTMADWEPAYALTELRSGRYFRDRAAKYSVKTVGITQEHVTTMGGLKVLPDLTVTGLTPADAGLLILPGGDTWLDPVHAPIYPRVREFLGAKVPVAAICGATMGLAANGLLDDRHHTSNDPGFLKACCPSYRGAALYVREPAVCDHDLITASGVAPLEFAHEILKKLGVFSPETLDAWYRLYLTHESACFYALMESLPKKG